MTACTLSRVPRGGDPVEVRHAHVHEHDVRSQPTRAIDRLAAGGRLAGDLDGLIGGEDRREAGADQVVVVGDQDARHRAYQGSSSASPLPFFAAAALVAGVAALVAVIADRTTLWKDVT